MDFRSSASRQWFSRFAWGVLAYNIPVILWGAYVRVSFSGDGCGDHWPFCNGQVIPHHMAAPMAIEFTHRLMTSVDSFAVIAMCIWAFLAYPKKHRVRLYSILSLVFLLIEALLGAGLVLLRYVARDQSAGRAGYLSAHLTNTMLLLAALTATAWLAYRRSDSAFRWRNVPPALSGALLVTIFVSITGAIAALGDTLFPAASLAAGMRQDFAAASSVLLRLRMLHPVIAVLGSAYLIWVAAKALRGAHAAAARVLTLTIFQVAAGTINIALLAPVWMQLFHLMVADLVWISVVLLAMERTVYRGARADREPILYKAGENLYAEHNG
ncbi:MAG TPA: COX15/CtaA family protein [Bryobacteraceae bacterium]|jgi:heme A synthase|nr:COX15/CtaA family protein [Bryobacteraceae bacterium]